MNVFPPEQPSEPGFSGHPGRAPHGTDDALRIAQEAIAATHYGTSAPPIAAHTAPYSAYGSTHVVAPQHRTRSLLRMLIFAALACMIAIGIFTYASSRNAGGTFTGIGRGEAGSWNMSDESWSYYHQSNVNQDQYAPRWDKGFNSLTTSSKWQYDGPYQYGTFGRSGMKRRQTAQANGTSSTDPIYGSSSASTNAEIDDVFAQYGVDTADPTGGAPVGADPAALNPWYDPYSAGRSNPYENRLQMTWGTASKRDAWMR